MHAQGSTQHSNDHKHPKCITNLRWYFMEYCNNTSIHGFKYLGERRSSIEKLWWGIVLIISIYFCISMILKTYQKWERSPVIVSFATSETPIWKIPFPAVTICPRTKTLKSKFNFTEYFLLNSNAESMNNDLKSKQYEYMSLVCANTLDHNFKNDSVLQDFGVIDFLMEVQPDFNSTVANCLWTQKRCLPSVQEMFQPIVTSEGICYSFNMLDRDEIYTSEMAKGYYDTFSIKHQPKSEWSLENGYNKDTDLISFPRRTIVAGSTGGFDIMLLTSNENLDYMCGDALQGYDIILHHPALFPSAKEVNFRVALNEDVTACIKPNMMKTSVHLKNYKPEVRDCYFTGDRQLRFFKTYNQHDCLIECLANFTYKYCGCVGFYMPRANDTTICGPYMQWCINNANTKFLTNEVSLKIEEMEDRHISNQSQKNRCNCLQSCYSLDFDATVSQSQWNWGQGRNLLTSEKPPEKYHLSRLRIYFKDMQFITSQRNELYGETDFFANCGGLLGLFTGFSIISLAEIMYFITLRLYCNLRKYGIHYWSGADELISKEN